MIKTIGYAAQSANSPLEQWSFERRELQPHDVLIDILYCGVCRSDIEFAKNEWQETVYPVVPGHEIVGRVIKIGSEVRSFNVGDLVAPALVTDSCGECHECKNHCEQYCQKGFTMVYNSFDKYTNGVTYGGFSKQIVTNEQFVVRIPDAFKENLAAIAPLLCAGITTYSPLKHWHVSKGKKVGIIGIGGLGHIAVQFAHALGAHVVVITTSQDKKDDAKRLGADEAILSTNQDEMKKHANSFDFLLNTIPVSHDLSPYISLLALDGTMCLVGIPAQPNSPIFAHELIFNRRSLAGSLCGSVKETQEMLDFAAKNGITADINLIPIQKVNEAFEDIINKKVRYRYVIDMASL